MAKRIYVESFDDDPGGWIGWDATGATRLELRDGYAVSHSPWWVDFNHAPPGAGYLHILFAVHTRHEPGVEERLLAVGGPNRFVKRQSPVDFTDAEITVRLKGAVKLRGAQLVLLIQGDVPGTRANQVLTGQPLRITPDWSQQTLHLVPDPTQWRNMGSRHDRRQFYGTCDPAVLLRNVNCDIILVLFPLDVVPLGPIQGDPHELRAGVEYEVDPARLPEGHVLLDEVRIVFPHG